MKTEDREANELLSGEEEAGLRELGEEVAKGRGSVWQPRAVARTFARRGAGEFELTMQGWIDLDFAKSPLLEGGRPLTIEQLEDAFAAFENCGRSPARLSPNEAVVVVSRMQSAVERAFSMVMPMQRDDEGETDKSEAGTGAWLAIMGCLVAEMGLTPEAALALPVGRAFALIAGMRGNQGCRPKRGSYAERELGNY